MHVPEVMRQARSDQSSSSVGRVARRSLGMGSALFQGTMLQCLWLTCCLWAYVAVVRAFGYEGFVIVTPVDVSRLVAVFLSLIGLSLMLPSRVANPADYVVIALFDISFVPFSAYWVFSDQPWWQGLLVAVYWVLVLLVSRVPIHVQRRYLKGAQSTAFLVARCLVILGAILILAGGHLTLRLPFSDVYAARYAWGSEGSGMSMYLFPWLANALLPVLMAHAWKNRRHLEFLVLVFAAYMLFTSTGMKAYLVMPALMMGVLVIARWRPSGSFIPFCLGVFASVMILLDKATHGVFWTSLGLRRAVFVPARLTSVYMEFFAGNPTIHLSDSLLFRGLLRYPYVRSVAHTIGAYLGQPSMGANNGLAADGFANFGFMGVLIWAIVLGLLLKFLRVATGSIEDRPESWAAATMWPVILLSSALTTSLLTHGLALGLLFAFALKPAAGRQVPGLQNGVIANDRRGSISRGRAVILGRLGEDRSPGHPPSPGTQT